MSSRRSSSTLARHGEKTFEYSVRPLRLSPSQYVTSGELKEWVRRNKDPKYVPSQLLAAWRFDVNVELSQRMKKHRKRAD